MILYYPQIDSTMDAARECVRAGDRQVVGVRAGFQSAGRGRQGGVWMAPPDTCLLVTYILYEEERAAPTQPPGALAFTAAVAVTEAIREQTGLTASVKWPNDLLLSGRKTAGILIETVTQPLAALVGIGLNVNVPAFPPELAERATSLMRETGRPLSVKALEESVRRRLFAWRSRGWSEILTQWRAHDVTAGRRYRINLDGQEIVGVAEGVNDEGALLLRTPDGMVREVLSATSL
jgi:BirA family biotin operon repressor/biotin-[acetyl-CoA-carboxylase] ligase